VRDSLILRVASCVLLLGALASCLTLSLVRITFTGDYPPLDLVGPPQGLVWLPVPAGVGTPLQPARPWACTSTGVGAYSFTGAAMLVGGEPTSHLAAVFCADADGIAPPGVSLGGQPLLAAVAVLILAAASMSAAWLPAHRLVTAGLALLAILLLAAGPFGVLTLSVAGRPVPAALPQLQPDTGFWVAAGMLAAVSLLNVPPGRRMAGQGPRAVGF
jgi:hypothetical protein